MFCELENSSAPMPQNPSIFFNEPNLGNVTPRLTDLLWKTLCSHKSKIPLNDLEIQFLFWSHTILWPYSLDKSCLFINNTSYHTLSSTSANSVQMCIFVEVFIKTPKKIRGFIFNILIGRNQHWENSILWNIQLFLRRPRVLV